MLRRRPKRVGLLIFYGFLTVCVCTHTEKVKAAESTSKVKCLSIGAGNKREVGFAVEGHGLHTVSSIKIFLYFVPCPLCLQCPKGSTLKSCILMSVYFTARFSHLISLPGE